DTSTNAGSLAAVGGPGSFTRLGVASITFNSTLNHTGQSFLLGGGTTTTVLSNTASFSGGGTLTVSGVLMLASGATNRIADSTPVVLRGGTLSAINGGSGNEQFGGLILDGGQNVLAVQASNNRSFMMSSVVRNDRATLIARGNNLGGSSGG